MWVRSNNSSMRKNSTAREDAQYNGLEVFVTGGYGGGRSLGRSVKIGVIRSEAHRTRVGPSLDPSRFQPQCVSSGQALKRDHHLRARVQGTFVFKHRRAKVVPTGCCFLSLWDARPYSKFQKSTGYHTWLYLLANVTPLLRPTRACPSLAPL